MCDNFQGWTNRETWAANIWIENEQGLMEVVAGYTRQELEGHDEGEEINSYHLGEAIRDYIENEVLSYSEVKGSEQVFTMLTDIGSLYRVNWREIAEYYLEGAKESFVG
jgi:hypothetical protein